MGSRSPRLPGGLTHSGGKVVVVVVVVVTIVVFVAGATENCPRVAKGSMIPARTVVAVSVPSWPCPATTEVML